MGQVLYRKYRSKKLAEIVGQEHITQTLAQALQRGKISHAYLFTGPRGVGKTSIARILAREINQLPYTDDSPHIDIIEIDAASNRRIDEVRDLRDKVYIAPVSAKYKVYIIDEVHMLTREAFNALLKTLEEPPAHVVFILATTDAHKLPETIVSRTQRYAFKPVAKEKVVAHLTDIAKQEKIAVDTAALELLAEHGEGSFRDSISLLDQAASQGDKVTLEMVQHLLGIPPAAALQTLVSLLQAGSSAEVMRHLTGLQAEGYQASAIAKQLGTLLREQLINNSLALPAETTYRLMAELVEVPGASNAERYLEIVLLRNLQQQPDTAATVTQPQLATTTSGKPAQASHPKDKPVIAQKPVPAKPQKTQAPGIKEEPVEQKNGRPLHGAAIDSTLWPQILQALKQKHNTLYGVVRMAEPLFGKDGGIKLNFAFAFHQKRINEQANRQILIGIIRDLTGQTVSIECVHNKAAKPLKTASLTATAAPPAHLQSISNIFGGGELLES